MQNKVIVGNFLIDFVQEDTDLFSVEVVDCASGYKKVDPTFYHSGEAIGSSVAVGLKGLLKLIDNVRVLNSIDYKLVG